MSGSEFLELESDLQSVRDLKLGVRTRHAWARIKVTAQDNGISDSQLRGFIDAGGFQGNDARRKELADGLGIDWAGFTAFIVAIAPIIEQMMAGCGA